MHTQTVEYNLLYSDIEILLLHICVKIDQVK